MIVNPTFRFLQENSHLSNEHMEAGENPVKYCAGKATNAILNSGNLK
jgi:hypothetical protein